MEQLQKELEHQMDRRRALQVAWPGQLGLGLVVWNSVPSVYIIMISDHIYIYVVVY